MRFNKIIKRATFLDPFNEFNEGGRECEIRTDPLTGRNARILFFPIKELPVPDFASIKSKDTGFCPFCPENIEKVTPKFNPAFFSMDRFRVGEAVCFPNAFPYDENGAVTVMSRTHFIYIDDLTRKIIKDSILCCLDFLEDIMKNQPEAVYQSINWNYLPEAGGSIIHPHLQITASADPTNYYTDIINNMNLRRRNTFIDLINNEIEMNERYLSAGEYFSWMIGFAPEGIFDLMAVSHEYFIPSEMNNNRLDELVTGILNTLSYIKSKNIISFNMSLFFLLNEKRFFPHMRLCPRTNVPPLDTSEINYMKMLHNEPMSTMKPEVIAAELKKVWRGIGRV